MAVRQPLYYNSSSQIQAMTTAQVDEIIYQCIHQYALNRSVSLSVVASGGSLDSMVDTRLQAGASSTRADRFPTEAETAEPSVVSVTYDKLDETVATVTPTADNGKLFPAYYNSSGQIQSMNLQDMKDTFLHPAIDFITGTITSGADGNLPYRGGSYYIYTGSDPATTVFINTRADLTAYSGGSIPEAQDQFVTNFAGNFNLQSVGTTTVGSETVDNTYTLPLQVDSNDNLKTYSEASFESILQEYMRDTAANSTDGYKIRFNINGSGNNLGTGMTDSRYNGSGNYATRYVNTDDYRAQEFPNGTLTTINTYYLKINKV